MKEFSKYLVRVVRIGKPKIKYVEKFERKRPLWKIMMHLKTNLSAWTGVSGLRQKLVADCCRFCPFPTSSCTAKVLQCAHFCSTPSRCFLTSFSD